MIISVGLYTDAGVNTESTWCDDRNEFIRYQDTCRTEMLWLLRMNSLYSDWHIIIIIIAAAAYALLTI